MPLSFAIIVTRPVYGSQHGLSALRFIQAALRKHHHILGVFFYQDGVTHASSLTCPANDEFDMHQAWLDLAKIHAVPLYLCVSAGLRRGLLDAENAAENGKQAWNVAAPFEIAGLGQLAELMLTSDRVVRF
jgi:tRNA 2-thiouridine synthesizing protein D